jgi:hypothetical protein
VRARGSGKQLQWAGLTRCSASGPLSMS